jgi:hypothetical protein
MTGIVTALLVLTHTYAQAPAIKNPELREELLKRVAADQAVRNEWIKQDVRKLDEAVMKRMERIDADNSARIKAIVTRFGWPGPALVGKDGTEAAFLLVQHADHETQKAMLPIVTKAFRSGELSGPNYALLADRVLVRDGKPQIYGTQAKAFNQWKGEEPVFEPIQDEANVDVRRRDVGLPPMAEYRRLLKQLYFPKKR